MRIFFLILLISSSLFSFAGDEIRNSRLQGVNVNVGNILKVTDDKFPLIFYPSWYSGFESMTHNNKVEFGLDETKHVLYNDDFSVEITFNVTATDKDNLIQTFLNQKLKIYYKKDGSYEDKTQFTFNGFSKIEVNILAIDTRKLIDNSVLPIPNSLFLEAEVATQRNYKFQSRVSPNTNPTFLNYNIVSSCTFFSPPFTVGVPTDIEVYWDFVPGADEYELEWTWVNDYPGSSLEYNFKYDATRIITKNTFYKIPLNYESGYILYRLRNISKGALSQRVEGDWTNYPETGIVSAYPANMQYHVDPHSGDIINWSSTTTFDENGKKGTGISYMDGMLMGRQSLAKLNTENKLIAQSVIYDFQGRPAISILPTPISSECNSYKNNLNINAANVTYTKLDFDDKGVSSCENPTDVLNVNYGAANYYSPVNSNKEGAQGYLPESKGLPFVQVEYTDDMTGRIKSQSMPGEAHKIGDGKETKFFYANPGDGELIQLFGSEVGNVTHYDKNIVKDANGQLSASYIDMEGRVIATALLGQKPANVDGIEDYNNSTPFMDDLSKFNIQNNNDYSLTSTKSIFVEQAGNQQIFEYQVLPEDYNDECAPSLCFDCIYELEINITDDCNNNIITPISVVVGNISPASSILDNCDLPSIAFAMPGNPLTVTFPKIGNYIVTKTLKVSDINVDLYLKSFLQNNTCIPTYNSIFNNLISQIDASSCNTDCQSCLTSVASYTNTHTLTPDQITELMEDCDLLCENQLNPCADTKKLMLQDFYPGEQYALYDIDPITGVYSATDNTSMLNPANVFNVNISSLSFFDSNGNPAFVNVLRSGVLVPVSPNNLTLQEFVQNFQPSWANTFLIYHPEKCYLDFCEQNLASDRYDYEMLSTTSYDQAYQKGYFNPISSLTFPSGICPSAVVPQKLDPFFVGTGFGAIATINKNLLGSGYTNYYGLMIQYMNNSYPINGAGIDLYDVAQANVYGAVPLSNSSTGFGCDPCQKDNLWMMYRALYLQQKMRLVAQARTDYAMSNGCFNGCMQNSGLNPFQPITSGPVLATSLNFIQSPTFISSSPIPTSPYEFNTITGYPIVKSPYSQNMFFGSNFNLHDAYNQIQSPIFSACSSGFISYFSSKLAHFQQPPFTQQGLLDFYNSSLANDAPESVSSVLPALAPALPNTSNAVASVYCLSTCQSYAEQWINKLKNCNPIFDNEDPSFGLPANVIIRNQIMAELINVCTYGCDPQNPFGSSSVNPAILPAPAYSNFQQVIDHFSIVYPTIIPNPNSLNCNYLNLDFPEPYGHDYSNNGNGNANKLDTCGCNKILVTQLEFNQKFALGTLPVGITTVEQFFANKYSVPIYNFNELACKCNATAGSSPVWFVNFPWTAIQSQSLLSSNLVVPDVLVCTKCLICADVVNFINSSNAEPISSIWNVVKNDNILASNYLNNHFNMNLEYDDYINFYNSCGGISMPYSSTCNAASVNAQLLAYINAYILIAKAQPGTMAATIVVTKLSHPAFFGSCLFPCANDADIPNTLTITIPYTSGIFQTNNPLFSYSGGVGACASYICNPKFDVLDQAFAVGSTGFVVTTLTPTIANPYFNFSMSFQWISGGITHVENGAYFNYPCLNPNFATPPVAGDKLCDKPYIPTATIYDDCLSSMMNQAATNAKLLYQSYISQYSTSFINNYKKKCIQAKETYNRNYSLNEYHYTLYYYDQAGNLTRTVPPKGVKKLTPVQVTAVQNAVGVTNVFPTHNYVTNYQYQSYGAPIVSNTPDEQLVGVPINTDYYYDGIGRIQVSQNGKQKSVNDFSYTLYDALGRIREVGIFGPVLVGSVPALKLAISNNVFEAYIGFVNKREVIKTYYDAYLNVAIASQFGGNIVSGYGQKNLRNRVATVTYEDVDDGNNNTFSYATHYTYDEHGNVPKIIQDFPPLEPMGKRFSKIDYEFDLISGNVNKVYFQKDILNEQFMHRYEYDDDNRLHNVYTSKDGFNWDKDAKYFYYEHGPLARVETGDQKVQGTDFAYTIHGWIKAVNSNILSENVDMGKDGASGNSYFTNYSNVHQYIGKDASGYSLNYYQQGLVKDYTAIKTFASTGDNQNMIANTTNISGVGGAFDLAIDAPDLFNGNISSMVTSIYDKDLNPNNTHAEGTAFPQITAYKYDQLHRLMQMKSFRDVNLTTNSWNPNSTYDASYFTQLSYDKNGNITSHLRNGNAFVTGQGLAMDNLTYITHDASTARPTNQLIGVNDALVGTYATDIKGTSSAVSGSPSSYDYSYDEIGNLVKDKKEFILTIEWTTDRKVKRILRDVAPMVAAGKNLPDLEFEYDANRQRVCKIVKARTPAGALLGQADWKYTYYMRDASGNVVAIYNRSFLPVNATVYSDELKIQELNIYGSSRLGITNVNLRAGIKEFTPTIVGGLFQSMNYSLLVSATPPCFTSYTDPATGFVIMGDCPKTYTRTLGNKRYELTNHLGNVLSVVSDRKLQVAGPGTSTIMSRIFDDANLAGVTGVPTAAAINIIANQLKVTPLDINSGVNFNFPTTIGTNYTFEFDLDKGNVDATDGLKITTYDAGLSPITTYVMGAVASGHYSFSYLATSANANVKFYFTSNINTPANPGPLVHVDHFFNIDNFEVKTLDLLTSVVKNYMPEILETHDYYAFGMDMPGRSVTPSDAYKYGFNGKINEKELSDGAQDFDARMYDNRLGKFMSSDPQGGSFSSMSPYAYCDNNPVIYSDPNGEWKEIKIIKSYMGKDGHLHVKKWYNVFEKTVKKEILIKIHSMKLYVHQAKVQHRIPYINPDPDDTNPYDIYPVPPTIEDENLLAEQMKNSVEGEFNYFSTKNDDKNLEVITKIEIIGPIEVVNDLSSKSIDFDDDLVIFVNDITDYFPDELQNTAGLTIGRRTMILNTSTAGLQAAHEATTSDAFGFSKPSKQEVYIHELFHQLMGDANHNYIENDNGKSLKNFNTLWRIGTKPFRMFNGTDPARKNGKGGGRNQIKKESIKLTKKRSGGCGKVSN